MCAACLYHAVLLARALCKVNMIQLVLYLGPNLVFETTVLIVTSLVIISICMQQSCALLNYYGSYFQGWRVHNDQSLTDSLFLIRWGHFAFIFERDWVCDHHLSIESFNNQVKDLCWWEGLFIQLWWCRPGFYRWEDCLWEYTWCKTGCCLPQETAWGAHLFSRVHPVHSFILVRWMPRKTKFFYVFSSGITIYWKFYIITLLILKPSFMQVI